MNTTYTLDDLKSVAKELLHHLQDTKIVLFHGDIGAGKTTLIKTLVEALGGRSNDVSSPTFSLVNEYVINNGLVYHFDFYRVKDSNEALDIGFEEYVDSGHWIFIEWPEKIMNLLHLNEKSVYLSNKSVDSRFIKIKP